MSTHRYWRVFLTTTSTPWFSIAELQLASVIGGPNLCVEGVPFASSVYGAAYPLAAAFDGDPTTRWATLTGTIPPAWLGYDFITPVDIVEVRMTAGPDSWPTTFSLQYSDDNITYTTTMNVGTTLSPGSTQVFNTTLFPQNNATLFVTQMGADILYSTTNPPISVTQLGADVLYSATNPPVSITQMGVDVLYTATAPPINVTQMGVDVWYTFGVGTAGIVFTWE